MLNFSGYTIEETDDPSVKLRVKGATELDILKNHEFESSLQRMSVLVRDNSNGRYYVFCKGSPEKIHDLSVNRTIPHNFKA
jgi:cation-transporting ATPase 13A3/4/5